MKMRMTMKIKAILLFIPMAVTVHVLVAATNTTTTTPAAPTTPRTTTAWPRTTAFPGWNLKGKMFTLSQYNGGVSLYPPSYSPSPSPSYYPWRRAARYGTPSPWRRASRYGTPSPWRRASRYGTPPPWRRTSRYGTPSPWRRTSRYGTPPPWRRTSRYGTPSPWRRTSRYGTPSPWRRTARYGTQSPWRRTGRYRTPSPWAPTTDNYSTLSPWAPTTTPYSTSSYPAWTTASPSRGVSMCARYFAEINQQPFFDLSPHSSSELTLTGGGSESISLTCGNRYYSNSLYFSSFKALWSYIKPDFWTRVCVTVDTRKGVAQVFRDGLISVRKRVPLGYVWRGEPVIDILGFDGQVTDVHVWDFPLTYSDIYSYMTNGAYGPYRGNVITWSDVSYSVRERALLEDTYEWQRKQPIRGEDSQPGPVGEKKKKKKEKKKFSNQRGRKERKREKI